MQSSKAPFMRVITRQSILLVILSVINFAIQAETLWQQKSSQAKSSLAKSQHIKPIRVMTDNARYMQINQTMLDNTFSNPNMPAEITLPLPNGLSVSVNLSPSPILSEDLAEQYPSFMTFQAQQINQPKNIGRFSISHLGLFGFLDTTTSGCYYHPYIWVKPKNMLVIGTKMHPQIQKQ